VTVRTRGRRGPFWTLITPDNHYASRLPGLSGAVLVKLVTPRFAGARFGQYLVDLEEGGGIDACGGDREHFVYVLEGAVDLCGAASTTLPVGGYAYRPPGGSFGFRSPHGARLIWVQRHHEPWGDLPAPGPVTGHRDDAPFEALAVPGLTRRELLAADDPSFDFNMSLLRFGPGAALDRVEIHDEEHGLYMTAGAGVYLLDRERHDVREHDFIHMAPYCPQSFVASAEGAAEYLLYKDVFRTGF